MSLPIHYSRWRNCTRCAIGRMATHHVFARGELPCDVLFIGEGPGRQEDAIGEPFVGNAGARLDDWIHEAQMQCLQFSEIGADLTIAFTNIVCCRTIDIPFGPKRDPSTEEATNCSERLREMIEEVARPRALVLVGRHAQNWGWNVKYPMLMLTHPSFYLRRRDLDDEKEKTNLAKFFYKVGAHKIGVKV